MTKLPEPDGYMPYPMCHIKRYTEEQMLQFRRDALDEAALLCDELSIAEECAYQVRKLKETNVITF